MKKAAAKAKCCCDGYGKIESGLLILVGLILALQAFGAFPFGGQSIQIIGAILILVIGAKKWIYPCCD